MEQGQIQISVFQGPYGRVGGRQLRSGKRVSIHRPGRGARIYKNPSVDSFVALTNLIRRHALPLIPWGTMVGYTVFWTPGTRATGEVESGDES